MDKYKCNTCGFESDNPLELITCSACLESVCTSCAVLCKECMKKVCPHCYNYLYKICEDCAKFSKK